MSSICGTQSSATFADTAAAPYTQTISGLTTTEKCSWVMQVGKGAPSFKVTTAAGSVLPATTTGYDLHYVEYGATAVRESGSGSITSWLSMTDTTSPTTVKATLYDKAQFDGIEWPPVYIIINPTDALAL